MKAKEFRELSIDELEGREKTLTEEFVSARFKHATNQLEKTSELTRLKRDIARCKTVLAQKKRSS